MPDKKLIGFDANQVPTNGMLGTMAFQQFDSVNITGGRVNASAFIRVITASGNATASAADEIIVMNKTANETTSLTLPSSPATGKRITIKDGKGDAATRPITITPAAGNIDGSASTTISTNWGFATYVYNGTQWNRVS